MRAAAVVVAGSVRVSTTVPTAKGPAGRGALVDDAVPLLGTLDVPAEDESKVLQAARSRTVAAAAAMRAVRRR